MQNYTIIRQKEECCIVILNAIKVQFLNAFMICDNVICRFSVVGKTDK